MRRALVAAGCGTFVLGMLWFALPAAAQVGTPPAASNKLAPRFGAPSTPPAPGPDRFGAPPTSPAAGRPAASGTTPRLDPLPGSTPPALPGRFGEIPTPSRGDAIAPPASDAVLPPAAAEGTVPGDPLPSLRDPYAPMGDSAIPDTAAEGPALSRPAAPPSDSFRLDSGTDSAADRMAPGDGGGMLPATGSGSMGEIPPPSDDRRLPKVIFRNELATFYLVNAGGAAHYHLQHQQSQAAIAGMPGLPGSTSCADGNCNSSSLRPHLGTLVYKAGSDEHYWHYSASDGDERTAEWAFARRPSIDGGYSVYRKVGDNWARYGSFSVAAVR